MILKRLLLLDGVTAVCHFRDNGDFVEGYGLLGEQEMVNLAKFAHDYKRIVQANADQLSMFTQVRGWTPPRGWIVRGPKMTVCSVGNLVCLAETTLDSVNEIMTEMAEAASR